LEALDRRLSTLDSEINYVLSVVKQLTKLEGNGIGSSVDPLLFEHSKKTAKDNLDRLRFELKATLQAHSQLRRKIDLRFNPMWGALFKERTENSRFGQQVEDYACIYTSRVSNFLAYSPLQYFRSQREHMPHELLTYNNDSAVKP